VREILAAGVQVAQKEDFSKAAIAGFYKGIWTLFYSEYFLLPFL
jgi:hypothetical protein